MAATATISELNPTPLKIETGVPLAEGRSSPARGQILAAVRELAASPVGASFFVPASLAKSGSGIHERTWRIGGRGWAAVRKTDGGFRVWKIAEPKAAR